MILSQINTSYLMKSKITGNLQLISFDIEGFFVKQNGLWKVGKYSNSALNKDFCFIPDTELIEKHLKTLNKQLNVMEKYYEFSNLRIENIRSKELGYIEFVKRHHPFNFNNEIVLIDEVNCRFLYYTPKHIHPMIKEFGKWFRGDFDQNDMYYNFKVVADAKLEKKIKKEYLINKELVDAEFEKVFRKAKIGNKISDDKFQNLTEEEKNKYLEELDKEIEECEKKFIKLLDRGKPHFNYIPPDHSAPTSST